MLARVLKDIAPQVLASGSSYDGQEGSLCVLNTKLVAPGGKSPFLPASSGGGGCNLGLNCVSLSVSPHAFYLSLPADADLRLSPVCCLSCAVMVLASSKELHVPLCLLRRPRRHISTTSPALAACSCRARWTGRGTGTAR